MLEALGSFSSTEKKSRYLNHEDDSERTTGQSTATLMKVQSTSVFSSQLIT
jgi:hypothetical protein